MFLMKTLVSYVHITKIQTGSLFGGGVLGVVNLNLMHAPTGYYLGHNCSCSIDNVAALESSIFCVYYTF